MTAREPRVAIDGPAGAGKSTVARLVAERLGYLLQDTGALYRAIAFAAKEAGVSWKDDTAVGELAGAIAKRDGIRFAAAASGPPRLILDGRDISELIRTLDMGEGASVVSALPAVRASLLELQRAGARDGGVVLEGRDIGTVVLPDAEAKVFLTASVGVRAGRRYRELVQRGETPVLADVERAVEQRDARDTERAVAPLKQAEDAVLVDSTNMSIDEVVDSIVRRVGEIRARLTAEPKR